MEKEKTDGESAFPHIEGEFEYNPVTQKIYASVEGVHGMSLRDYFAAKAMQSLLSNPNANEEITFFNLPKLAYDLADLMIEARK